MPKKRRKKVVDRYAPARRLHQLKALLNSTGGISIYEIAERLRISVRTAIRYLQTLEAAGEPLYEEMDGRRKIWRLKASARHETITLTTAQMMTLFLSRRVFDFLAGTGFKEDLDDVFEKLESLLKRKDFVAARNLDRKVFDVNEAPHIYADRIEDVNDIVTALLNEDRLRCRHDSVSRAHREFVVEPYSILIYKKGLYLVGKSVDKGELRTFALDGFREVEWLKGDHFEYPADYHPSQMAEGQFGLFGGARQVVRVFFTEKVARLVRRRRWHPTQQIKSVEGGIELTIEVAGTTEIASWVLGWGDQALVLEPAELRDRVAGELQRAAARCLARAQNSVAN